MDPSETEANPPLLATPGPSGPAEARLRALLERLEAERAAAPSAPRRRLSRRGIALALALACLGLGAVALVTPSLGVRRPLSLPFSDPPAPSLEMSVAASSLRPSPTGGRPNVHVEVALRPHGEALRAQPVTLQIDRAGAVTTRRRSVSVAPGVEARIVLSAPLPGADGPWTAGVSLPGRPEALRLDGGVVVAGPG